MKAVCILALATGASAFVAPALPTATRTSSVMMSARSDRAEFLKGAVAAAGAFAVAMPALAEIDNAVIPFLGGGEKVDLNNANVRAYIQFPGMYPSVAGKIVSNGPYSTVGDVYNIKTLTDKEKAVIKKYESKLVTTEPQPMYQIDRINNGLYR